MDKVYIDCDIILDLLSKRNLFLNLRQLYFNGGKREINACVSPLILQTCFTF